MDTAEKERREILAGEYEAEGQKGWSGHLLKYGPFEKEHAALRAMAEAERRAFERGRAAGREEAGWRDIESAPKSSEAEIVEILVCEASSREMAVAEYNQRRAKWRTFTSDGWWETAFTPTHWMPLPEPPTPPLSKREGAGE